MSTCYISEYSNVGNFNGNVPVGQEVSSDSTFSFTGTAGVSSAFKNTTCLVRIHVDGIASVLFGTNPTATTTAKRFVAGQSEYFFVQPGQSLKVSAITNV